MTAFVFPVLQSFSVFSAALREAAFNASVPEGPRSLPPTPTPPEIGYGGQVGPFLGLAMTPRLRSLRLGSGQAGQAMRLTCVGR